MSMKKEGHKHRDNKRGPEGRGQDGLSLHDG